MTQEQINTKETNLDKWIAETIGQIYKYAEYVKGNGEIASVSRLTYGDLHRCKDIINERGEWKINNERIYLKEDNYKYTGVRGFVVKHTKKLVENDISDYKTADEAEGALRKALDYIYKQEQGK